MTDKQIGNLTSATALTGSEITHVVQSGNSRKTTTQDIANLSSNSVQTLTNKRINPRVVAAPATIICFTTVTRALALQVCGVRAR